MTNLDLDKRITGASVRPGRDGVDVVWSDGHLSSFLEPWLIARRFTDENRKKRMEVLRDPELFGADYQIQRAHFGVRFHY